MNGKASHALDDNRPLSFEEFRDLWAAEETRSGLVGRMQRVILWLLSTLVAMLADARAKQEDTASGADVEAAAADRAADSADGAAGCRVTTTANTRDDLAPALCAPDRYRRSLVCDGAGR